MSLPSNKQTPDDKDPRKITTNRIVLWVLVGGFALYLIGSGIIGIITKG